MGPGEPGCSTDSIILERRTSFDVDALVCGCVHPLKLAPEQAGESRNSLIAKANVMAE